MKTPFIRTEFNYDTEKEAELKQIERYTEGAKDSSGVVEERFKNAQETLTIQLQKLRQQFNLLIVSLMVVLSGVKS